MLSSTTHLTPIATNTLISAFGQVRAAIDMTPPTATSVRVPRVVETVVMEATPVTVSTMITKSTLAVADMPQIVEDLVENVTKGI